MTYVNGLISKIGLKVTRVRLFEHYFVYMVVDISDVHKSSMVRMLFYITDEFANVRFFSC